MSSHFGVYLRVFVQIASMRRIAISVIAHARSASYIPFWCWSRVILWCFFSHGMRITSQAANGMMMEGKRELAGPIAIPLAKRRKAMVVIAIALLKIGRASCREGV